MFCVEVSACIKCTYVAGMKRAVLINVVGIANHEEYSLVRDLPDSEREKTLTLKRDKSIAKDQKKMDEMKKKLHTDDECMFSEFIFI